MFAFIFTQTTVHSCAFVVMFEISLVSLLLITFSDFPLGLHFKCVKESLFFCLVYVQLFVLQLMVLINNHKISSCL